MSENQNSVSVSEDWVPESEDQNSIPVSEDQNRVSAQNKDFGFLLVESDPITLYYQSNCDNSSPVYGKTLDENSHQFNPLHDSEIADIMSSLQPIEDHYLTIQRAGEHLEKHSNEIYKKQQVIESSIEYNVKRLHEALDIRKSQLIGKLRAITKDKLDLLAAQKDQITRALDQLDNFLISIKNKLKSTDFKQEIPRIKKTIAKRHDELTSLLKYNELQPVEEANINFSSNLETFFQECLQFGKVYCYEVNPMNCELIYKEQAVVGEKSTILLNTFDFIGKPCVKPIESLKCLVIPEFSSSTIECNVKRKSQNQYGISFKPTIRGNHQLLVKIEGVNVSGSPFVINVKLPVKKLDSPNLQMVSVGGVNRPWSIAVSGKREVIVSESYQDCISFFNFDGGKLKTFKFGKHCKVSAELNDPRGVTLDTAGNILIVDKGNRRILKFSTHGQLLSSSENHNLTFNDPTGICVDSKTDRIYITDNHCIHVLNTDLTLLKLFGEQGTGNGQFWHPRDVTCNSTGILYVADSGNHRVQVYSAEGKFLRKFGKMGSGNGEFSCPSGISTDSNSNVYVSESENRRISVFTSDDHFLTSFGSRNGELKKPCGLAVDTSGIIYVCDFENNCFQII